MRISPLSLCAVFYGTLTKIKGGAKMNRGEIVLAFATLMGLLAILILAGCPGTMQEGCCPKIKAFKVDDPWVCPERCPGGGKTRIHYEIEFWKENELCEPPKGFRIHIKNTTDDVHLPPLKIDNPKKGVYKGVKEVTLTKDVEYKLIAKADEAICGEASRTLKVNVVDKGDKHQICFSGPLDKPKCTYDGGFVPFGPGVLIDHIDNPSSLRVRVDKDSKSDFINPYKSGYGLSGEKASGDWAIGLTNDTDCGIFGTLPKDQQKLCVDVFLKCNCP